MASGLVRAEDAEPAPANPSPDSIVVVKGIRGSLASSINIKRDAQGVVDGIFAEDIGKFPDTNLAESLQRISGVSIDRSIGEGSRVTVRGVGPDFNMVLLNGRQMPASSIQDTGPSNSRAFDFANLASESISQIQVYKTSRASSPTGGIGATINIITARPLDNKSTIANVSVKGVTDTSNDHIPDSLAGSRVTPEVSGIYSSVFDDGKFGVALSGSYQKRNLGYNTASVGNGWRPFQGDTNDWGTIPQPGTPGAAGITNRPGPKDIYSVPQNLNYAMNGVQRERTNGQLVLQYAPVTDLKTTLDYTYSENKVHTRRNDLSAWFNFGPSTSSWTNGPVSGPNFYSETIVPANSDIAMGGANFATKNQNKSLGFNVEWKANDKLKLELDAHHSTATSGADSPFGSNNVIGTASFNRGTTTADFTHDFPVLSIAGSQIDPTLQQVTGSSFRNSYMKSEVDQVQVRGQLKLPEYSSLDFGLSHTKVKNRSAYSNVQRDTWGGATNAADYPDSLWHPDTIRQYFDKIDGSGNPALFNNFFTFDFGAVRDAAIKASGRPDLYTPSNNFDTDRRVQEKSQSAFVQYNKDWDFALPVHTAIGARYEKTDVVSSALVPTPLSITWVSQNELSLATGSPGFTTLTGSYKYFLPSADVNVDVTDDVKARASVGETIGRPGWGDIQGGQTLNQLVRVNGGTGAQGNPALKPLKSRNLDLSLEWYYQKGSFASIGYFRKLIDNYVGVSTVKGTPGGLHTPIGGAFYNEALTKGCANSDTTCIRNYILKNHNGAPGVTRGADDAAGNATGTITGQPGDPVATFDITLPANQRSASLDGWEINLQHNFGTSGFGVSTNFTKVDSGLKYDNASLKDQFALEGLSNSANVVLFYEVPKWYARAAFNWRGQFLAGRVDGTGLPNPVYTEAYGQLDLSFGYNVTDKLSLNAEVINANDGIQRQHGRTRQEVLGVTQTGPRYMIGASYKF
jgi:TonB-dependent receptor